MNQCGVPAKSPDATFEQRFFVLLMRIYRHLLQHAEQNRADDTLSPSQLWFLKRLFEAGTSQPISFFADGVFSNLSNASQMIDRLEADGLVNRVRNPRDRRSVLVELTDLGAQRMRHADERHQQMAQALLEPLSEGERVETLATFERVLSLLENRSAEADKGHS